MFTGTLSRGRFAKGALIRIALLVAITAGFPFILRAIFQATACARVGGACGAVALVASFYLKPLIYLAFVFSFVGITMRRLRDLALPAAMVIILVVLMLGDLMFGITFGAPWSLGFVLGGSVQWPRYLFASLLCIAFLCLVPSVED